MVGAQAAGALFALLVEGGADPADPDVLHELDELGVAGLPSTTARWKSRFCLVVTFGGLAGTFLLEDRGAHAGRSALAVVAGRRSGRRRGSTTKRVSYELRRSSALAVATRAPRLAKRSTRPLRGEATERLPDWSARDAELACEILLVETGPALDLPSGDPLAEHGVDLVGDALDLEGSHGTRVGNMYFVCITD